MRNASNTSLDPLLKIDQVIQALGVSRTTVHGLIDSGRLPGVKMPEDPSEAPRAEEPRWSGVAVCGRPVPANSGARDRAQAAFETPRSRTKRGSPREEHAGKRETRLR